MMSVQTSVGSLLWDMAEWDPGNEPRHHAKVRCCGIDESKTEVNLSHSHVKRNRNNLHFQSLVTF